MTLPTAVAFVLLNVSPRYTLSFFPAKFVFSIGRVLCTISQSKKIVIQLNVMMNIHLLLAALLLGNVKGQVIRTCSFVNTEPEEIYIEDVSGSTRNLRDNAVDRTKAKIKIAPIGEGHVIFERMISTILESTNSTASSAVSPNIVPFQGLHCNCTGSLTTTINFYCPVTSKSCEVVREYSSSNEDYSVLCTNENWMVTYARHMWYYLIFWFVFLVLSLFLTAPGQVRTAKSSYINPFHLDSNL